MANDPKDIDSMLQELQNIMDLVRQIVEEDRQMCVDFYNELKEKWSEEELLSELGSIERELNNALSKVISSTEKIPKMLDSISKILTALVKERALLQVSRNMEKVIDINNPEDKLKLLENFENSKAIKQIDQMVDSKIYMEK